MYYTAGENTFPLLVTGISGEPVIGLTTGFTVTGEVGGVAIAAASISESSQLDGWYLATVTLPVGQGYLQFGHSNTNYSVTGGDTLEVGVYDVDDVYSNFARRELDETSVSIGAFETQNLGTLKEGDDWDISYVVPSEVEANISGYSDWKASIYYADVLTSASVTGSGYIGDFDLTVNADTSTVRMQASHTITDGIVPEGVVEITVYSDLQAEIAGKRKTFAEFTINARRHFTKG